MSNRQEDMTELKRLITENYPRVQVATEYSSDGSFESIVTVTGYSYKLDQQESIEVLIHYHKSGVEKLRKELSLVHKRIKQLKKLQNKPTERSQSDEEQEEEPMTKAEYNSELDEIRGDIKRENEENV